MQRVRNAAPSDNFDELVFGAIRAAGDSGISVRELAFALRDQELRHTELRLIVKGLCRQGVVIRLERDLYAPAPRALAEFVKGHERVKGAAGALESEGVDAGAVAGKLDKETLLRFVDRDETDSKVLLEQLAQGLGVDRPFELEVLQELQGLEAPEGVPDGAEDWRDLPFATIDGADAKDFDDAVLAQEAPGGVIVLRVAIADVARYVAPGSLVDEEARVRGNSVYLPGRVFPMLPPRLSEDLCSLRPGVPRAVVGVRMEVSRSGEIIECSATRAIIRSHARLTYELVDSFLEGAEPDGGGAVVPIAVADDGHGGSRQGAPDRGDVEASSTLPPEVAASLHLLGEVARRRLRFRRRRGNLDLNLPEPVVSLSEDGRWVEAVEAAPRGISSRLIEECMLAANESVADLLLRAGWPMIHRVHGEPDGAKLRALRQLLRELVPGTVIQADPTTADIERVLAGIENPALSRVVSWLILRTMQRAAYSLERVGHYALGTDRYVHFTAPIRRYADLENHRMLVAALSSRRPAPQAEREVLIPRLSMAVEAANRGEGIQTTAERTSDKMMRALYMRGREGEIFDAMVSDVARFGIFVTITSPYVEGLIPIRTLGDDYYEHDERRGRLVGSRKRRVFQAGQALEVICSSVDVRRGEINFELVEDSYSRRSKRGKPATVRKFKGLKRQKTTAAKLRGRKG